MSVLIREIDGVLSAMNSIYSNLETESYMHNVSSTEDSYVLQVPLVGISKEDLSVEVKDNVLYVSAKTKIKSLFSRDYKKTFQLHKDANLDTISAKLENGLLTVTVDKIKPVKKTVSVNIL